MKNPKQHIQKTDSHHSVKSKSNSLETEKRPERVAEHPHLFSFSSGASSSNIPMTPSARAFLHHTIGNHGIGHVIQAKLQISQPNDPYEREADRIADAVIRMPDSTVQRKPT